MSRRTENILKIDNLVKSARLSKKSVLDKLMNEVVKSNDYIALLEQRLYDEFKKRR